MPAFVCLCVCVCLSACMCICIRAFIYVCLSTSIGMHVHVPMFACVCLCAYMCVTPLGKVDVNSFIVSTYFIHHTYIQYLPPPPPSIGVCNREKWKFIHHMYITPLIPPPLIPPPLPSPQLKITTTHINNIFSVPKVVETTYVLIKEEKLLEAHRK